MEKLDKKSFATIAAVVFDVDGVLTDGKIILDNSGHEIKQFNVKDGQLVGFLRNKGLIFGAISGRSSNSLKFRLKELQIDFQRLGVKDKEVCIKEFSDEFGIEPSSICYIGDDIIDVKVMKYCGIAVCPADANYRVFPFADMVTVSKGGEGVLREILDIIIEEKGWLEEILS